MVTQNPTKKSNSASALRRHSKSQGAWWNYFVMLFVFGIANLIGVMLENDKSDTTVGLIAIIISLVGLFFYRSAKQKADDAERQLS